MKRYRWITIVLIILLLSNTITILANSEDYDNGRKDGEREGFYEGREIGTSDYYNRKNTKREALRDAMKDLDKKLNSKSKDYIKGYQKGFEIGFDEGYERGYTGKESEKDDEQEKSIVIYGPQNFGEVMGRIDGYTAYKSGNRNDWKRYVPRDREIIDEFELDKESRDYRYGFIDAFKEAYRASFETAYQVAKLGEKHSSYEQGLEDGEEYSRDLGELNGRKDYLLGLSNNYKRNMPTKKEIIDLFNLDNESIKYKEAFLAAFEFGKDSGTSEAKTDGGYMLYYNEGYRTANKEVIETPNLDGREDGESIGRMKGEYAAIMDITLKKPNNWDEHRTNDKVIIDEYGLQFQSKNYREFFIIGYWDGFMKSYNETYKRLQQDANKVKVYTEKITIDGKENIGIPEDDKFLIDIEPGTYFNDIVITLDSIPDTFINLNSKRHTKASPIYGLKVINLEKTFDKNKKVTIKFKSYGNNEKYGIYKYHYNKWIYIPSEQKENYLVADINLKNIDQNGNIYAVRIDNELPSFHESRGHWARSEINTYVKREIIYGYPDNTFKPEKEITRGEFVTMLSRLYDWYPPYDSTNVRKFKDHWQFGYAEKAISYATYYNIVNGYPDGTFRPNNPITYREVEIIMSKVLGNAVFKWDYFSNKILYEKKVRSSSKDSMNNKITRGEFTYLLHELNEWQY